MKTIGIIIISLFGFSFGGIKDSTSKFEIKIENEIVTYLNSGKHSLNIDSILALSDSSQINTIVSNSILKLGYLNPWLFYYVSKGRKEPLKHFTELNVLYQKEKDKCIRTLWFVMFKYYGMNPKDTMKANECKKINIEIKQNYNSKEIQEIYQKYSDKFGY
jgi:hypothetical protein